MRSLTRGTERGGHGARRVTALLTLVVSLFAIPATASAAIGGGLKQLPGTKGCIVDEAATPSGCEDVRAMQGVGDVAVAPDGENVYVTSVTRDAIVAFDRNPNTGELTQKSSITGCYTSDAAVSGPDGCSLITGVETLNGARGITVSPDNKSVYVVSDSGRLSGFDRDDSGTLSFNLVSFLNSGGNLTAVSVSSDGATIYPVGTGNGGIVAIYSRDTTAGSTLGDFNFKTCFAVTTCSSSAPNLAPVSDVEVTPDAKQVLIMTTNAMLAWDRTTTAGGTQGDLTPTSSPTRCVSNSTLGGTCQVRVGMEEPRTLALADQGAKIYLGNAQSLITVNRDPGTNVVTPDTAGNCFGYPGSGFAGCTPLPGTNCCTTFYTARAVATSPDGQNVYFGTEPISSPITPSIFGFSRSGGGISLKPTPLGCTNTAGVDGCALFREGNRIQSLAVANDSRQVYAVGNNRLFTFAVDRPPTCANVGANTAHNTSVAVKFNCSDPDGDAVVYEKVTDPPKGTLGGVQGDTINYNPLTGSIGPDSFSYRAVAAGVASDPATATVNVAGPPPPPPPPKTDPTLIPSTVANNWASSRTFTMVITLSARKLPAGAKVVVNCKTKKKKLQKKRCPYKSKTFQAPAGKNQVNLAKLFRKKKLPIGTTIKITITAPNMIGKVFTYTIRRRAAPKLKLQCLAPGATKPGKCS